MGRPSGLTSLEAMMSGTPVIVSDIPPFRELTDDGRVARLVGLDDVTGRAAAVQDTLQDRDAAELRAARAYKHAQRWRVEPIVDRLLDAWTGSQRNAPCQ